MQVDSGSRFRTARRLYKRGDFAGLVVNEDGVTLGAGVPLVCKVGGKYQPASRGAGNAAAQKNIRDLPYPENFQPGVA